MAGPAWATGRTVRAASCSALPTHAMQYPPTFRKILQMASRNCPSSVVRTSASLAALRTRNAR